MSNKRFSRFNLWTECNGEVILYNTLTGALASFTRRTSPRVKVALATNDVSLLSKAMAKAFVEDGYIISSTYDEVMVVRARNMLGRTQNEIIATILLTMGCNFDCGYCFERKSAACLTPSAEERIIRYFERTVPKKERVSVDWYGGEPLLQFQTLVRMNDRIADICSRASTPYIVSITTNGYCLTPKVISYLHGFEVDHLQITLDGPAETHNLSRPLKNGEGTFVRILDNIIDAVAHGLKVTVRVNVWKDNIDRIGELYHTLEARGLKNRVTVLLKSVVSSDAKPCDERCLSHDDAGSRILDIYKAAAIEGWIVLPFVEALQGHEFCIVDSVGQLMIDTVGNLYKCGEHFDPGESVGTLGSDGEAVFDEEKWMPWITKDPFALTECHDCRFLPICMGGCSMKRFWRGEKACIEFAPHSDKLLEVLALNQVNIFCQNTGKEETP